MAEAFDAVIVGGGAIGLSIARELARAGVTSVALLERNPAVGQGSSARANGGVRAQFSTAVNVRFSMHSIGEFERLERESPGRLSLRQEGYLLFTGTEEGEQALRRGYEVQRSLGVDVRWLTAQAVLDTAPFLRPTGLRAGTFHGRDGFLDPHGLLSIMASDVVHRGVIVETGAEVTGIERAADSFRVRTTVGDVRSRWLVNAAGPDAARIAAMASVDLPVYPVRRNLAYVREIEGGPSGLFPMCVDLDTGVLVRPEGHGGYVLAYSDPDDPPSWSTSVDPRFIDELARRVGNRFPFLEHAPVNSRHCWAGLYPETPDHHAIVGEAGPPNMVHCVGFGGHGLMHAPAAGRAVAELVTRGACTTFDLRPLRPSRFDEGDVVPEQAVL